MGWDMCFSWLRCLLECSLCIARLCPYPGLSENSGKTWTKQHMWWIEASLFSIKIAINSPFSETAPACHFHGHLWPKRCSPRFLSAPVPQVYPLHAMPAKIKFVNPASILSLHVSWQIWWKEDIIYYCIWRCPKRVVPRNWWLIMENPFTWMMRGYLNFKGNLHIYIIYIYNKKWMGWV